MGAEDGVIQGVDVIPCVTLGRVSDRSARVVRLKPAGKEDVPAVEVGKDVGGGAICIGLAQRNARVLIGNGKDASKAGVGVSPELAMYRGGHCLIVRASARECPAATLDTMRIARFTTGDDPRYALVDGAPGEEELVVLSGDPMYIAGQPTGERIPLNDDVRLLAPVIPRSKIVCLGKNFEAHARELAPRPNASSLPLFFLKPNTTVIGPDDPIIAPSYSEDVQLEAELAVVIGRLCKDVSPEAAEDYIYGFTCANDVTARDIQRKEDQWFRAKAFDSSLPLGPWIETELAHDDVTITSRINGTQAQTGHTGDMILDVATAVSMVSEVTTLLPGDVVLMGTPAGVTTINHGDVVEIEIEDLGVLRNPVVRR